MPKRENPRVSRVLENLKQYRGVKAIKIHGSVYQQKGNPDIIACIRHEGVDLPYTDYVAPVYGQMVVAEMKTELGQLSKIQRQRLKEWFNAGAKCIVSTDAQEVTRLIVNQTGNWTPNDLRLR